MANILHRLTIDAPTDRVAELIAGKDGIEQWWTGRPVAGSNAVGGRLTVHFVDPAESAAAFEVLSLTSGAEGRGFIPFPGGEISRWD